MATIVLLPQWLGEGEGTVIVASTGADTAATPGGGSMLASTQVVPVVAAPDEPAQTYTTPQAPPEATVVLSPAQLASYLVAHSEYTSPLSRSSLVTGAMTDEAPAADAPAPVEGGN